jgi:glycosyltransferase involved in cell wall biosynthesis
MNILILSVTDEGGAGIAINYINQAFLKQGHHSVFLVKESSLSNPAVLVLEKPAAKYSARYFFEKVENKLNNLWRKADPLDVDMKYSVHNLNERKKQYSAKKILDKAGIKPDMIIFCWISGFINAKTIKEFSEITDAKLFWMCADNAVFTGACHYPWDCKGYLTDCSNCPAIIQPGKKIIAQKNLAFKKQHLPANIEIIATSEFDLIRMQEAAVLKDKKIHSIVAPVNDKIFVPGDKSAAKKHFGIDEKKKVIFLGAKTMKDPRKGVEYMLKALQLLKEKMSGAGNIHPDNVVLLSAGEDDQNNLAQFGFPVVHTGYMNMENLAKAYQAATFFACPSVEDTGPSMINQSIQCGTPVVAFRSGIALDLVHHQKSGYVAELFNTDEFAKGMEYVLSLNEKEYAEMCSYSHNLALNKYSTKIFVDTMINYWKGENGEPAGVEKSNNIPHTIK